MAALAPHDTGAPSVMRRALRLLARHSDAGGVDSGVVDVEQALDGLRADAAEDPDALAGLDLAVAINREMVERGRRQRELAALYETAGDLSSLHDVEQVLQAIVNRARSLLRSDAAYLMLVDHARGDNYMRVTDGIRTDSFKQARLAMGAGLGGLVAQARRPYATSDYAEDERFVHTVDDIVSAEGLVAVIGVPLVQRDEVIGVLFATNRRQRPFSDAEVALLISLANHATIAIETASLFAEVRANGELVERAASLHEQLTKLVVQGGRVPELALVVAEALSARLVVADPQLAVLASAGGAGETGEADQEPRLAVEQARLCRQVVADRATVQSPTGTATPVVAGSELLAVMFCERADLAGADLRTLERAALVSAIVLLADNAVAETEQRVRGELLDDLFADPQPDADGLRRRARLLGTDLDRPHVVVIAAAERVSDRRVVTSVLARWSRELGGICGEHGRAAVALVPAVPAGGREQTPGMSDVRCDQIPAADPETLTRQAGERVQRAAAGPVTVGGAGPGRGPVELRDAHRGARSCVDVLCALDQAGAVACPSDLGSFGLLFGPAGRDRTAAFVRRTLGPVLDYDAQRGSELVHTIEVYFACDANLARAAARLFIHINTLYQRIERITALLGDGWRSGDAALQLHLAVRLQRIMAYASSPPAA